MHACVPVHGCGSRFKWSAAVAVLTLCWAVAGVRGLKGAWDQQSRGKQGLRKVHGPLSPPLPAPVITSTKPITSAD